jgi:hypothetical protein
MSDELQTGEQALAEGRGKIELPEVEMAAVAPEPIPQPIGATVIEHSEDGIATVTHLPVEEEPIDAVAEHVKGSINIADIAEAVLSEDKSLDFGGLDIKVEDFFPGATPVAAVHDEVIVAAKPKKNALGTQDICPLKDRCNHRSADYCKQAKLEADHRRNCAKGHRCDCFHPSRGIPQPYRVMGGGDGRI